MVPGSQDKLHWDVGQKPAKLSSLEQSVRVQVGSWERRKLESISAASHLCELESVFYFSEKGGRFPSVGGRESEWERPEASSCYRGY